MRAADAAAVAGNPKSESEAAAADLVLSGVSLAFGGIQALTNVSLSVRPGELVGLIGPNGAGKTSVFNVISRTYTPQSGAVRFGGRNLLSIPAHRVAAMGVGRTFQNIALFPSLTVIQNVALGCAATDPPNWTSALLGTPRARRQQRLAEEAALAALRRIGIADLAQSKPDGLPQGLRRQVEVARALVAKPRMLLLDEPAAGLNHEELEKIGDLIRAVNREEGVSILLIEHRMDFVMKLVERLVVLDFGRVIATGVPEEIQHDERVLAAYLGVPDAGA